MPQAAGWRALTSRGFADLSPPEAEHALLELPTQRAEYVDILQDMGDYPARSPIGQRVPSQDEVAALSRMAGRWRAVVPLEDERCLKLAACVFDCVFVLDPLYDTGGLLYAAWHDPLIRDEHSRRLAEQAARLVRAGPLLSAGTAVLAPEHLPGSWNPRPGWTRPRRGANQRQLAAWSMRTALVLVYWADRLNGLVCTSRPDVIAALDVLLGPGAVSSALTLAEHATVADAQSARVAAGDDLGQRWSDLRRLTRRRARGRLEDVACAIDSLVEAVQPAGQPRSWRLALGETSLPEPAPLVRRILNGQDPERQPPLPRLRLRRRPLCLVPAASDA